MFERETDSGLDYGFAFYVADSADLVAYFGGARVDCDNVRIDHDGDIVELARARLRFSPSTPGHWVKIRALSSGA